ncbi:histone chaperone Rttp106-like-domain-containing protein [Panaeolus papilionaceus]|nr:histone chaperone Rttp106-like-domain-containing protein [Panaeolus papilionaceus]
MSSEQYLRAIVPHLPKEIASKLRSLCVTPANEVMLENLIRIVVGASPDPEASKAIQDQWSAAQAAVQNVLKGFAPPSPAPEKKRGRDDDLIATSSNNTAGPTPNNVATSSASIPSSEPGKPLFTFHALSTTSPIRKKVDITIHENAFILKGTTGAQAIEGTVPRSSIKRAFIVPTRGKSKPHWTVILIASDISAEKGKATVDNQQIIFGVDATSTSISSTSTYDASGTPTTTSIPKGTEMLPVLKEFARQLGPGVSLIEPVVDGVFKSALPGTLNTSASAASGIPGVEAYRAAKAGNLWFAKEGILWGESKPCEFWAVEDLLGKSEGVRIVGAGAGRTCSVVLTRKLTGDAAEGEEDMVEESEFGMIDTREREGINDWVRKFRHLFGRRIVNGELEPPAEPVKTKKASAGPITIRNLMDESEDDDDDFETSISDLDGSERSTDGEGDDSDDDGDDDDDAEGEDDDEDDEDDKMDEDEPLDPRHHPLLRPGAMPKISKAALEMAVGIVENDFMGSNKDAQDEEDEEDELDD